MKISDKAQITIFIILAIIIIISLILFFSVKGRVFKEEKVSPQIASVYSFVDSCIEKTGEDAIYNIGQTGGYFLYSNKSTENGIAYYFDKNKAYLPTKEQIENELSLYVNELLFFCAKNFVDFPDFEISQDKIKTQTKMARDKIIFKIKYPLTISKGNKKILLENFEKEIPSRLETVYKVASGITEEQMLDFENICINCVSDLAFENKVFVSMNDDIYDKNTIIFTLIDDQYKINGEDYRFYFANRYDLG